MTTDPTGATGNEPPEVEGAILWHCNFWDGPLTGVCLARAERDADPGDESVDLLRKLIAERGPD